MKLRDDDFRISIAGYLGGMALLYVNGALALGALDVTKPWLVMVNIAAAFAGAIMAVASRFGR